MGELHGGRILSGGYVPTDIQLDNTAVIGIVGTANLATVAAEYKTINKPVVLLNDIDYPKYLGEDAAGFTLREAVEEIYATAKKFKPLIVFVNVFDPAKHANVAAVTVADIIGSVDAAGNRTGLQALLDAKPQLNIVPKIIIVPGFSSQAAVSAAMGIVADKLRAVYYVDSEVGSTVTAAISARTTIGKAFNTADKRCSCCFPYLKSTKNKLVPFSVYKAAVRARTDLELGFWYSDSSKSLDGVIGVERSVTYKIDDENSEANQLNVAGIVTYKNVGGLKINGSWNASYPTNTQPDQFECTLRTADVIDEAIIRYMEQKIDLPIYRGDDASLIDDVINDVNAFLNKLRGAGAILGGKCWYEEAQNNPSDVMAGKLAWSFDSAATPPLNRFTFYRYNNIEYYQKLGGK